MKVNNINLTIMSEEHYHTERAGEREKREEQRPQTVRPSGEREIHYDSPTKYDIDFYQRKVNRLENDLTGLQEELSLTKYRLQKAEDFEDKYESLFNQHQNLNEEYDLLKQDHVMKTREAGELRSRLDQAELVIRNLEANVENGKATAEEIRRKKDEAQSKASNQGVEERQMLEQNYLRQIENMRREAKDREEELKKQAHEAQRVISNKEIAEDALKYKLEKIKAEKNEEIGRLKDNLAALKDQLSSANLHNDSKLVSARTNLVEETDDRIAHVRKLSLDIENTLMEEIRNLNETVAKKDAEIAYLLRCDKDQIVENEGTQKDLKAHIRRLQDKIFVIQRENEVELFTTVARLQQQYEDNVQKLTKDFDQIQEGHREQVSDLKTEVGNLKGEIRAMEKEHRKLEDEHKRLSLDKELSVKMLSEKILGLEKLKDDDFKNYTTSMRNIEEEAKSKLDDLHAAVLNKNNEFEILNAQLVLKNEEINYLLDEIQKLRDINREKMRKLETANASEQNALNELISSYKKEVLELKRRNHELESTFADEAAQAKLKVDLARQDLSVQKEANAKLQSRNDFLANWCKELEGDIKKERMSNVDILHDHTVSRRETVQIREQVKVELEAIKDREIEQIKNIFGLEKNRLESELAGKQMDLEKLKSDYGLLLVDFKNLERKVGKPSKFDKGAEDEGKCRATLEAEIKLTENIFNAMNKA